MAYFELGSHCRPEHHIGADDDIGAQHDTMDPAYGGDGKRLPRGGICTYPDGSHMSMFDDQERYFSGLIDFLRDVDRQS